MGSPADILPSELKRPVLDARLLLVGAGGIGCEVLKNLVLAGFRTIEVVSFVFHLFFYIAFVQMLKRCI